MADTISPTDPGYFADHDADTLRKIVATKTDESLSVFLAGNEALSMEAMAIANNAWAELVERGDEPFA